MTIAEVAAGPEWSTTCIARKVVSNGSEKLEAAIDLAITNYFSAGGRPGDTVEIAVLVSDTCGVVGAGSMTAVRLKGEP